MIEKREKKAFSAIDIARFVFSILIVAFHFPPFNGDSKAAVIVDFVLLHYLERLAVPFYFVCSGFFLFNKSGYGLKGLQRTRCYYLRILRLYLVWSLIYFPLNVYSFQYDESGSLHAILVYIRNFFFTGSYFHLWYLNALIIANMLIALLQKREKKPEEILVIAGILYVFGLLAQSWFGAIKPLCSIIPELWLDLKRIKRLIGTTRNGLFEGFLYVGIGMFISVKNLKIRLKESTICFAISVSAFLFEILVLNALEWSRETDLYIFQIPSVFFLFMVLRDVNLRTIPLFRTLRKISGLVYYVHPLLGFFISLILETLFRDITEVSTILFVLIVVLSIMVSILVLSLSNRKSLRFLKLLYA